MRNFIAKTLYKFSPYLYTRSTFKGIKFHMEKSEGISFVLIFKLYFLFCNICHFLSRLSFTQLNGSILLGEKNFHLPNVNKIL